jgi:hypothetical protein
MALIKQMMLPLSMPSVLILHMKGFVWI